MKLKLHLFVTDPAEFLKGNHRNTLATLDYKIVCQMSGSI